jgi:Uma2 family endonuclease
MEATTHITIDIDEYLRLESASEQRHEFVDGLLYAQAGASRRHNHIVVNITRRLGDAAERANCELMVADVKLRVTERFIYYPDIMVVCDPSDDDALIASKPCLVIEVLSPSTEDLDHREKLFAYRQVASLEHYLIIAQDQPRVECWSRSDAARWQLTDLRGEGVIQLSCPALDLTLADIYRGVFEQ